MDIRLLGTVEIRDGGHAIPLVRAGERCILASLALAPGTRIAVDTLVDRIWDGEPPSGANRTVASYLGKVRYALRRAGGRHDCLRNHRPAAYQLDVAPECIDYHRFQRLVSEAVQRRGNGDTAGAVPAYELAVSMRHGEPLADLGGSWATHIRWAIEQKYVEALCQLYASWLELGAFARVATGVADLLTQVVPTDRLILLGAEGLAGSGQRTAIQDLLQRATIRMRKVAGAEPSPELRAAVLSLSREPSERRVPSRPDAPSSQASSLSVAPAMGGSPVTEHPEQRLERPNNGQVKLVAYNAHQVFQASGDQTIIDGVPQRE